MSVILGIGGVTLDRVGYIPRMPGWDEVEYLTSLDVRQGGMAATAMMAAARLGADAEYIGGVGDDEEGDRVLGEFRRGGVRSERVKVFHGGRTPVSFVLVRDPGGERTIIHHHGVQERSSLEIDDINLEGVGFLHLDGYWFDTALAAAGNARRLGIVVSVDPSTSVTREKAEALFPLADYIIPSKKYAERLTGERDPEKAAAALLGYGAAAVIITMGREGCLVTERVAMEWIPALPVEAVDTTGAGDVFHGGFVYALSIGSDLFGAVRFASAAAALKCSRPATLPTREEVERLLPAQG